MLTRVRQNLQQAVARGNRGLHGDLEPARHDVWRRGLDHTHEPLSSLLQLAAQPREVLRFVRLAALEAVARSPLNQTQVDVLHAREMGERALDRVAGARSGRLEQARV